MPGLASPTQYLLAVHGQQQHPYGVFGYFLESVWDAHAGSWVSTQNPTPPMMTMMIIQLRRAKRT